MNPRTTRARPRWHTRLLSSIRKSWPRHLRRARANADLDAEIQAHLAIEAQQRMDDGVEREAAWRAARRDFGRIAFVKEETRAAWGGASIERLVADVRDALRHLVRNPTFTVTVVVVLALGLGATLATVTAIHAAFYKPLPVAAADELVWFDRPTFSYPIFRETQRRSDEGPKLFAGLFAWTIHPLTVQWQQDMSRAQALFVTEDFYRTLGLRPGAGRLLGTDDDRAVEDGLDGSAVVISDACWTRRFGRDPSIVGRRLLVERVPFTIVGITPRGFFGVAPGVSPEITLPLAALPMLKPEAGSLRAPGRGWLHVMGRLRSGLTVAQADAGLQTFWPQVMDAVTSRALPPEERAEYLSRRTALVSGATGYSPVRTVLGRPLLVLFGLVVLLLFVTCASVAGLLLVRGIARQRELALRLALGGTRSRIARALFLEGLLFALLATIVAAIVGHWGAHVFVALLSTAEQPLHLDLSLDRQVLLLMLAIAVATAIVFSLAPAIQMLRVQPGPVLKLAAKSISHALDRRPLGRLLVVAEVALAMLLLAGAALLTRSVHRLLTLDPGFDYQRLLLVSVDQAPGPSAAAATRALQERLRAVPGVDAVSLSWMPPVSRNDGYGSRTVTIDHHQAPIPYTGRTYFNIVSPGYFATMGQALRRGRDFGPEDVASASRICIVTESLARLAFRDEDPLGRLISVGGDAARQRMTIVGIVEDAKYQWLQEETHPIAYLPYRPASEKPAGGLVMASLVAEVRTGPPPRSLVEPIRRVLREHDPGLLARIEPLEDRVRESLVAERVMATLAIVTGAIALLLASTGLYGLLAYTVSSRTSEIGVRMALGARTSAVRWMVLRDSLWLSAAGLAAGLLMAIAISRAAGTWLQSLTSIDRAVALGAAAALTLVVVAAASLVPAQRAARIDPLAALRHE